MNLRTPTGVKMLRVGVTGHRPDRMPASQSERIKNDLDAVMADIETRDPKQLPVLLSGLAEGADRLAAFVALGRGWGLHAILAFHRARFEEDFPGAFAKGELRALLEASETIDEPEPGGQLGGSAENSYGIVGQRLLSLCSILIAVWDGEASRGTGGTVNLIEEAGRLGIPVVWVHASKTLPPRKLYPDGSLQP